MHTEPVHAVLSEEQCPVAVIVAGICNMISNCDREKGCRDALYTVGRPLGRDVLFCFLSEVTLTIGFHSSCFIGPKVVIFQKCFT